MILVQSDVPSLQCLSFFRDQFSQGFTILLLSPIVQLPFDYDFIHFCGETHAVGVRVSSQVEPEKGSGYFLMRLVVHILA